MNCIRSAVRAIGWAIVLLGISLPLPLSGDPANDPVPTARVPSEVAWTPETIKQASSGDPFRGMLLARRCGHCHGAEGFSAEPLIPNLAGIDRLSIWKQLQDFRSGKRVSPVMQPIIAVLSQRDIVDVSAYFSMLPTFADPQDNRSFPRQVVSDPAKLAAAQKLVGFGDGQRGIPPCQACHGPVGYVNGAPTLGTQNGRYVLTQLQRFADGSRANDINMVMRTIVRQLTAEELGALSEYYGSGCAENLQGGNSNPQQR